MDEEVLGRALDRFALSVETLRKTIVDGFDALGERLDKLEGAVSEDAKSPLADWMEVIAADLGKVKEDVGVVRTAVEAAQARRNGHAPGP